MLAYTYVEQGRFELREKPRPQLLDARDALVRVTLGSICTSDLHIKHGSVPRAVPGITVGHEMVGVVEEVGSAVTAVRPGDRVTVNVETFCGECFFCRHGFVNNCTDPDGGWALGCRIDGGQAEYVRVPYADQGLNRIPSGVSDEQALFVGDVLATGFWAARISDITPDDTVLVIGAGPTGICTLLCAMLKQPRRIIVCEQSAERIRFVREHYPDVLVTTPEECKAFVLSHSEHGGADVVLEVAGTEETVQNFLARLLDATRQRALDEVALLEGYAREQLYDADFRLMPWDWAYVAERYKQAHYALSDEEIKPYLELESVKQGIFRLADKLYGLRFEANPAIPVYHPDVTAYEVYEADGRFLGVLYMDFFPRATKKGGAWMTNYRPMYTTADGEEVRPAVTLCGNFTKPTPGTPSLLTFDELETFLHEFGHCLHGLLAEGRYASLTGTSVYRDFVELPSQLMENWASEKAFLDLFARHYRTGEAMPQALIDKIAAARNYLAAYANVRQLGFGLTDMAWHTLTADDALPTDVVVFEQAAAEPARVLPRIDGTALSPAFTHIFAGGYAAGYYGYKWAEVLEADAFALFRERGIFNREVADSFRRNILSKGGSEHPMTLYMRFRGHRPDPQALIDKILK